MNNIRTSKYVILLTTLFMSLIFSILFIVAWIGNYKDIWDSRFFVNTLAMFILSIIANSIVALIIYLDIKKDYEEQYKKYQDKNIKINLKRERSALLMVMLTMPGIITFFVVMNAYLKSGLTKKQYKFAIKEIQIKNIENILKQKKVKNKINKIPLAKTIIKDVLHMRKNNVDSKHNCGLYILQILKEVNIKFDIDYDLKEVYYIGMNY